MLRFFAALAFAPVIPAFIFSAVVALIAWDAKGFLFFVFLMVASYVVEVLAAFPALLLMKRARLLLTPMSLVIVGALCALAANMVVTYFVGPSRDGTPWWISGIRSSLLMIPQGGATGFALWWYGIRRNPWFV